MKFDVIKNTGQGFCLSKALAQNEKISFRKLLEKNANMFEELDFGNNDNRLSRLISSVCPRGKGACLKSRKKAVHYKPIGRKDIPKEMWSTFLDVVLYSLILSKCITVYKTTTKPTRNVAIHVDGKKVFIKKEFETCTKKNKGNINILRTDDHVELLREREGEREREGSLNNYLYK